MNHTTRTACALLAFAIGPVALAADTENQLVCVTQDIYVCKAFETCESVNPIEANSPDFWKFDLKKKEVTVRAHDGSYSTAKISVRRDLKDMVILQGITETSENFAEGIGWTVAIHDDTGRMSVSGSAHQEVIAILGSCHAL